jgi:TRAP-type uncharacterized transport system substrate-binding protein
MNLQVPIRLVSAPGKNLDAILTNYSSIRKGIMPAKVCGDMPDDKDLTGAGFLEIVLCQIDLPDGLVYGVMAAIFDNLPERYLSTYCIHFLNSLQEQNVLDYNFSKNS